MLCRDSESSAFTLFQDLLLGLLTKDPQKRLAWPHLEHHPFLSRHRNIHDIPYRPGTNAGRPTPSRPTTAAAGTTAAAAAATASPSASPVPSPRQPVAGVRDTARTAHAALAPQHDDDSRAERRKIKSAAAADDAKASARERRRQERAQRRQQTDDAAPPTKADDVAPSASRGNAADRSTTGASHASGGDNHRSGPHSRSSPTRRSSPPPRSGQTTATSSRPRSPPRQERLGDTYRLNESEAAPATEPTATPPPAAHQPPAARSEQPREAWRTASPGGQRHATADSSVRQPSSAGRSATATSSSATSLQSRARTAQSAASGHAPNILVVEHAAGHSVGDISSSTVTGSVDRAEGGAWAAPPRGHMATASPAQDAGKATEVVVVVTAAIRQLHEHLVHGDDESATQLLTELHEVVPHVAQPEDAATLLEAFAPSLLVLLQRDSRFVEEAGPAEAAPLELAIESALDLAALCLSRADVAAAILNNIVLRYNLARFIVARLDAPATGAISDRMLLLSVHFLALCVHATLDRPLPAPDHAIFRAFADMRREVAAALCDAPGSLRLLSRQLRHRHNHQALQVVEGDGCWGQMGVRLKVFRCVPKHGQVLTRLGLPSPFPPSQLLYHCATTSFAFAQALLNEKSLCATLASLALAESMYASSLASAALAAACQAVVRRGGIAVEVVVG